MTGNEREFCEPDFSDFSTLKVDTEHADKVGGFFSTSGIELQSEDGLELAELEADLFELPLSKFSYNKLVDFSLLANSKRLDRVSEDFSSGKFEIIAIFSRYDWFSLIKNSSERSGDCSSDEPVYYFGS